MDHPLLLYSTKSVSPSTKTMIVGFPTNHHNQARDTDHYLLLLFSLVVELRFASAIAPLSVFSLLSILVFNKVWKPQPSSTSSSSLSPALSLRYHTNHAGMVVALWSLKVTVIRPNWPRLFSGKRTKTAS